MAYKRNHSGVPFIIVITSYTLHLHYFRTSRKCIIATRPTRLYIVYSETGWCDHGVWAVVGRTRLR